jgi:hypothetical protein
MANTHACKFTANSSQYAWAADSASLSLTGDFSIEAWVKFASKDRVHMILTKWYAADDKKSYRFVMGSSNKLYVSYSGDGDAATQITATSALTNFVDVWKHYACAVDVSAKTAAIYVDGVAISTDAAVGTQTAVQDNVSLLAIGAMNISGTPAYFLDGTIDDVRLWGDIRTAAEIADNRFSELVGDEAGLISYWKLNNDAYVDTHANSNDLTAVNAPVFTTDRAFDAFVPRIMG